MEPQINTVPNFAYIASDEGLQVKFTGWPITTNSGHNFLTYGATRLLSTFHLSLHQVNWLFRYKKMADNGCIG